MQDPTASAFQTVKPQFPEQEQHLKCPRCESTNTKFCYYNNYNLSQPRHFCKNCRRYWTKGGALRNIPIGGGTRKNSKKRSSASSDSPNPSSSAPTTLLQFPKAEPISVIYPPLDPDHRLLDISGSFSSLLASTGHFGNMMEPNSDDLNRPIGASGLELQISNDSDENPAQLPENFLGLQGDSSCWAGGGWPDLAIYTPGSSFQ